MREYVVRLSREQEELLRALENDIKLARQELERAKAIGVDVSDLERRLDEAEKLRDELLKAYGRG